MQKEKVIKYFGNSRGVAEAIGVSVQYVYQWGDKIPLGMAYKIESVTSGELKVDPSAYTKKRERRYANAK